MKNVINKILILGLSAFLMVGCNEGPAEKKGKELDKTVESVKDKIQNKGPAQKAGEKIDDMTNNNN